MASQQFLYCTASFNQLGSTTSVIILIVKDHIMTNDKLLCERIIKVKDFEVRKEGSRDEIFPVDPCVHIMTNDKLFCERIMKVKDFEIEKDLDTRFFL